MGSNKALLKIGGQTLIERTAAVMTSLFDQVLLIANTEKEYAFLNLPVYKDVYKNRGPLGGIHSGLMHSKTRKILFFPVICL